VDARNFIDGLLFLVRESGAPSRLRDVGVTAESLPALARDAIKQTRLLQNNPVPLDEAAILAIYERAY
jgi:alcohol dehydrogenase class IV